MKSSILLSLLLGVFTSVSATPLVSSLETDLCGDEAVTLASSQIGEAKNVAVRTVFCPNSQQRRDLLVQTRATNIRNVCGANCNTNCFPPAGGGPDPNDCHVIADALRYDSQNIGPMFGIGNSANNHTVVMQYKSCKTFFANQASQPLVYCRTDWAALIDDTALNCQATQNAHGGNCVAVDQAWFVQVQHV